MIRTELWAGVQHLTLSVGVTPETSLYVASPTVCDVWVWQWKRTPRSLGHFGSQCFDMGSQPWVHSTPHQYHLDQ